MRVFVNFTPKSISITGIPVISNGFPASQNTPPKTNMDTQKDGLEKKVVPFKYGHLSYLC